MSGKQWQRRQVLFLLSGALGSVALHSCASSPGASGSSQVELTAATLGTVTWSGYTPLYVAQEKGFYKEFGLDLTMHAFSANTEVMASFNAKQVNGVQLVPSEAIMVAAENKDFRVVYVVNTSNGGDGILARNKITDLAGFKGQRIAVEIGGVGHFLLLQALAEAGLKESDVLMLNVTPDAAAAAYQAGRVDIAVSYVPYLSAANNAQKDGRVIYDSSKLKTPTAIADLILFDTEFAEQNPKAIEAFIRGSLKGLEFFNSNRQEGLAIVAEKLQVSPAEVEEQLKGIKLANLQANLEMLGNPNSNLYVLKPLSELSSFLQTQGKIEQPPDLSNAIEPAFVKVIAG